MHFLDHTWIFVMNLINVYIPSNILQILMNTVVHAYAFKSSLVSRVFSRIGTSLSTCIQTLAAWPSVHVIALLSSGIEDDPQQPVRTILIAQM